VPPPGRKRSDDTTPAALYIHCVNVYNAMIREAKIVELSEPDEEGDLVVWEGMLTALITQKMNLSVPYYTHVTRALKRMGCIRQLKRGGGTAPSQWELITDPTPDLFEKAQPPKVDKPTDKYSLLQQQVTDQNKRILNLEKALEHFINEAVQEENRNA